MITCISRINCQYFDYVKMLLINPVRFMSRIMSLYIFLYSIGPLSQAAINIVFMYN